MKRTSTHALILFFAIIISLAFSSLDEKGKIHLKVNKEENGEKSVFEKVYTNMDELKADAELRGFDVLIDRWAGMKGHKTMRIKQEDTFGEYKIVIKKEVDGEGEHVWISEDEEKVQDGDKRIIIKRKGGEDVDVDVKTEKIIELKIEDGERTFTIEMDGDGEQKMIWIDDDGNKTELTDADIEKMIQENDGGEHKEIHKKIKVITSGENGGESKVIVIEQDGSTTAEIEVEVKKELGGDGVEKIVEKKVWITKDGKKIELDEENDYEFETDGDNIKIKVGAETIDIDNLSEEVIMGENVMVRRGIEDNNKGINQTMNININEEDGEQYIEIDIKRSTSLNVTISDILKDDNSLDDIDYSIKNNLKVSQLNYYPNPNNGRFTLKFMLDKKEEVTIKVMDILGKEVYKETLLDFDGAYDNQIDLTGKEKGIYILQIIQKRKTLTRKILIE